MTQGRRSEVAFVLSLEAIRKMIAGESFTVRIGGEREGHLTTFRFSPDDRSNGVELRMVDRTWREGTRKQ